MRHWSIAIIAVASSVVFAQAASAADMQFVPSITLAAALEQGGPLLPNEARKVGAEVASALAAAHAEVVCQCPGDLLRRDGGAIDPFEVQRRSACPGASSLLVGHIRSLRSRSAQFPPAYRAQALRAQEPQPPVCDQVDPAE